MAYELRLAQFSHDKVLRAKTLDFEMGGDKSDSRQVEMAMRGTAKLERSCTCFDACATSLTHNSRLLRNRNEKREPTQLLCKARRAVLLVKLRITANVN